MSDADENDILVVGAGPAGLATSACLGKLGLAHVVVERAADVGSAWRRHYDRLHLHTTKKYSALPMSPWPRDAPRYPSREQMVDYLERYAAEHGVRPRMGIEVRRIEHGAGERFSVRTSAGLLSPRCVVIATGDNAVPNWPSLRGIDAFAGSVVHASGYRNAAPYLGKRTLVVGSGNSGAEIALDLAEHGVDVSMVVRGPVHVVPRDLLGRPTQHTAVLLARLPARWRDAIVKPMLRAAVGDLARFGIVRPTLGPNQMIETLGRIPMLDIGTVARIKDGSIRVLPGVEEVFSNSVGFADGRVHAFDTIVLATGYTTGLAQLIEGFEGVASARGRADRFGAKRMPDGLYFVGFRHAATGALREIALEAPRVAAAIARNLNGLGKDGAGR